MHYFRRKKSIPIIFFVAMLITSISFVHFQSKAAEELSLLVDTISYIRTTETENDVRTQPITIENLASSHKVEWDSSDPSIAFVDTKDDNMILTTYLGKSGTATVSATIKDKITNKRLVTLRQKITVLQGATGVCITDEMGNEITKTSLPLDQILSIYAHVLPENEVNVKEQKKITLSLTEDSGLFAKIRQASKTLVPNQKTLAGRGLKQITVVVSGYKDEKTLAITVDGGKLQADSEIDVSTLSFNVKLSVSGEIDFLNKSTMTLTGISGNALNKTITAKCTSISNGVATFVCDNNDILTDESDNYNGKYLLTSSISDVVFESNKIAFKDTNNLEKEEKDLALEAKKIQDVSFTENSNVKELLEIVGLSSITSGYKIYTNFETNSYVALSTNKFYLKKLNLSEKDMVLPFEIILKHPNNISTITVDRKLTLPSAKLRVDNEDTNKEAQKIKDVSFTNTSVLNDRLDIEGLSAISSDYEVTVSLEENEYVSLEKNQLVLKKANETESIILLTFNVKVTHPNKVSTVSVTKNVTVPIQKKETRIDAEILMDLILELRAKGATVSTTLRSNQYTFDSKGNLIELNWGSCKIKDTLDVSKLTNLESLICNNNQITSLEFSNLTNLKTLNCNYNQLTTLNLSSLSSLKTLNCNNNLLKTLDLSALTNLKELDYHSNHLQTLDLSNLTNLQSLMCSYNKIQTLDLSKLFNLQYLNCSENSLTILDLSTLPNLQELNCYKNQIQTLDLSTLSNLQTLNCGNNRLLKLELSNLEKLQVLTCNSNGLVRLMMSNLPSLQTLECNTNNLTILDLSTLPSLKKLNCISNSLCKLDLSNLTNLEKVYCDYNNLTSLNLSDLSNLQMLNCRNNKISSINLSNLTSLQMLDCYDNQLTSLDLTGLSNLQVLQCYNNQLTSLDLSTLINLQTLYCNGNQLSSLDLSKLSKLKNIKHDPGVVVTR